MFNLSKQNWSGLPLPLLLGSCCILELGELHHSWWWDQGRGFWRKEEAGRSESKRQQKSTLLWELEKKKKTPSGRCPVFLMLGFLLQCSFQALSWCLQGRVLLWHTISCHIWLWKPSGWPQVTHGVARWRCRPASAPRSFKAFLLHTVQKCSLPHTAGHCQKVGFYRAVVVMSIFKWAVGHLDIKEI